MYIEERHQAILDIITEKGSISTGEIQERFGVSYDSAKRDLRILEEKGLLRRTHGGAIPLSSLTASKKEPDRISLQELGVYDETVANTAKKAIALMDDCGSIYVHGDKYGKAICQELVRAAKLKRLEAPYKQLSKEQKLRITTNSPEAASVLLQTTDITTVLVGGELTEGMASDGFAVSMLSRLRFDIAVLTVPHYSDEFGVSCDGGTEQNYLTALADASRRIVAICIGDAKGSDGAVSVCTPSKVCAILEVQQG